MESETVCSSVLPCEHQENLGRPVQLSQAMRTASEVEANFEYGGRLSGWWYSFSSLGSGRVPREVSAAGCWEPRLCDAGRRELETRGHSVGAPYLGGHET
jgi:hypothetical protein